MHKKLFTIGIIFTLVIAAGTFLVLRSSFTQYQSTVTILVLPKSEKTALQADHVINNIVGITTQESYFTRVFRDSGFLRGEIENNHNRSMKLVTERLPQSGLITLFAYAPTQKASNVLAWQGAQTLFGTVSFYYNIKTDVDLRIVDGPRTAETAEYSVLSGLISIFIGCIGAFLILFIWEQREYFSFRLPQKQEHVSTTAEKKSLQETPSISLQRKDKQTQNRRKEEQKTALQGRVWTAPENLPIVAVTGKTTAEEIQSVSKQEPLAGKSPQDEPTDEELKARLNRLLQGDL